MGYKKNPYVRPSLSATLVGLTDPHGMVRNAAVLLEDALEHRITEGQAHEAYDVLASWGKLRRVRPELLAEAGADELMPRTKRHIHELIPLALTVPNTEAWLDGARKFDASYEVVIPEEQRVSWAGRLIGDLDDAELVLAVAEEQGHQDPELKAGLDSCRHWLRRRADLFYAASVEVQGIGQSVRPDLAAAEPALVRTAEKFVWLLDAFVQVEEELNFSHQRPLNREEVCGLVLGWLRTKQRPQIN